MSMKHLKIYTLLALLLMAMVSTAKAQDYLPVVKDDAEWNIMWQSTSSWPTIRVTESLRIDGDTLANDIHYKKVMRKISSETNYWHGSTEYYSLYGLIREEPEGKVFYQPIDQDTVYLLYDFGMNVGDTASMHWCQLPNPGNEVIVRIDSINTQHIAGTERRVYYVSSKSMVPNAEWRWLNTWIEGIGATEGLLYSCHITEAGGITLHELLCYHEDGELLYTNEDYNSCLVDTNPTSVTEESFYTCTKWYDSKINFVRYSNHFKDVDIIRTMDTQQNEPDNLVIYDWDIIQDATAGVVYGVDHNMHTDSAYISTDYGHTWTAFSTSREDGHPVYFWTFPDSPGVIAKGNQWSNFQVSHDFGLHFNELESRPRGYCFSGWNDGEFFDLFWQNDIGMMLHRTTDYYQTLETLEQTLPEYHWNYLGAVEGEFYKLYYAGPESDEARLYYSNDYGQNCRLLMEFDSTAVSSPLHGEGLWSVWIGREPGVFYTFKWEYRYDASEEGTKFFIDYYRSYGETLVTTYLHHFAPDWFEHHTPVMDCEIASYDQNSVTLRWNEPELKPDEILIGYQVYRGEDLVSGDLVTETEYVDQYSSNGRLKYYVLAVYSDGETSKSYNIVYCEQTEGVDENEGETKVAVFPNPANEVVHIEGVVADEVQVYNTLGQLVKTVRGTNNVYVEGLPQGIYLLRISDTEGKKRVARVTVK